MSFGHPYQRGHKLAGFAKAAKSPNTRAHLRSHLQNLSQGGTMAKGKQFSTSNKQRRTQPAQVTRTTNAGQSSLQSQLDTQPFTDNVDGITNKNSSMVKTGKAPASPVSQRPKTVSTNNLRRVPGPGRMAKVRKQSGPGIQNKVAGKNLKYQRKTKGPGAAFYGEF
jgi:hypothetical protein